MSKFDPYDHLHIKIDPEGTVERLLKLPPAPKAIADPNTSEAVVTKDITLDAEKNTSLRIYVPAKFSFKSPDKTRLPIVFYFHGCSFVQFRANNLALHLSRSYAACSTPAIIILVDYRLAPESRLPAQHEDAIDSLLWLKKQALNPDGEPWLRNYGDFSRCYLHGAGSGGNIIFNAALRSLDLDLDPLKIAGVIMNQPLFGGKQRTQSELRYATDQVLPLPALDLIWELALPEGTDRDHRYCNPMVDGPHKSRLSSLPRCLVFGFGMDPLIDRQQEFVRMLVSNGVRVEAHFDEVGFHRIEIVDPRRGVALGNMVRDFVNT